MAQDRRDASSGEEGGSYDFTVWSEMVVENEDFTHVDIDAEHFCIETNAED
jgi:hypothetical protein